MKKFTVYGNGTKEKNREKKQQIIRDNPRAVVAWCDFKANRSINFDSRHDLVIISGIPDAKDAAAFIDITRTGLPPAVDKVKFILFVEKLDLNIIKSGDDIDCYTYPVLKAFQQFSGRVDRTPLTPLWFNHLFHTYPIFDFNPGSFQTDRIGTMSHPFGLGKTSMLHQNKRHDDQIRPAHYGGEENPFEPIKIINHYKLNFETGNALKYILRADKKGTRREDIQKAITYLQMELKKNG